MQTNKSHENDILMKRKEVMDMLRFKSVNTFYKWVKESGVKSMPLSGGITVFWKSDIIKYLEELQQCA